MKVGKGSLFTKGKGQLYVVDAIESYKYRGEQKQKVIYYPIGDSGLMRTTKAYTCKLSDIGTKYTLLNWKF